MGLSLTVDQAGDNVLMARNNTSLLAELQAGLRDENSSTTALLQKCILLGGEVGSEQLRDWARQELRGYDRLDDIPQYRRFHAVLCIDAATFRGLIEGQQISSMELPDFARDKITEEVALDNKLGQLEQLLRSQDDVVRLSPPGASELVVLWNHQRRGSGDQITRLYWKTNRSAIAGVLSGVRTALIELVAEMIAVMPAADQQPSKEAADAAVHFVVTGHRNTITVVGSQTTTNGNSEITVTGSSDHPAPEQETWWQRWRKRGLIIGLATVVAAVAAVLQLVGWVPWK